MIVTRRTVVAVTVAALTAIWWPWELSLTLMVMVLVIALVDAWQVRAVPALTQDLAPILSRAIPSRLRIGLRGRSPRVAIRQPTIPDVSIEPQEADGLLEATIEVGRRGAHRLPPPATRAIGPLGFGGWIHRAGDARSLTVYPDMPAARHLAASVRTGVFREEGKRSRGPLGLGTEFESIRQYQPDDDIRQINWRASAKVGSPMSNQYRLEQDRDIICLVDCGRLMSAPVAGKTRLDIAVDAVAALAAVADQVGDRVGVVAFDDSILRTLRPRRDGGAAVVHAIHDLEPSAVASDFELAVRSVMRAKRAFVIIFTDLIDETAAEPLAIALPLLARKHSVTVAGVIDPDLERLVGEPARQLGDVMRAATAVRFLATKEQAVALLTHRGVQVVEARFDQFSARCVAAYLRAKRSARL